jgi:hypothetical protein
MTSSDSVTTTFWQGGSGVPSGPPGLPDLGSAASTVMSQVAAAESGHVVSYHGGAFTSRYWSTGAIVPYLIEVLPLAQVRRIGDELAEQLRGPGSGLDDIPLRAFAETIRLYLDPRPSTRFTAATFGAVQAAAAGVLLGAVSWPGVTGTVQGSADGILAQSHLLPLPDGDLVPLRPADLASLIDALGTAVAAADPALDPQWQQLLEFATAAQA